MIYLTITLGVEVLAALLEKSAHKIDPLSQKVTLKLSTRFRSTAKLKEIKFLNQNKDCRRFLNLLMFLFEQNFRK